MPPSVAAWFQFKLYLITLSGYSAESLICGTPEELSDDPKFPWQLNVDMIYRGIKCGLMNVWYGGQQKRPFGEQKTLAYVKELAQFDPDSDSESSLGCWVGPEIEATDLCEALIKKFDISNFERGEICEPFIEEIERLFEQHGVAWSTEPLIRIQA